MKAQKLLAKCNRTVVGWLLAALCVLGAAVGIGVAASRDLSLVLYVNGDPLCRVENKAVVDRALLLLEDRLDSGEMAEAAEASITYRYVSSHAEKADAERCMELLYGVCADDYARAYAVTLEGIEIAACATYAEAQEVADAFREYIVEKVMSSQNDADLVELTTEFEITSVFRAKEEISSPDEVCRRVLNDYAVEELPSEEASDRLVSAVGSEFLLSADKNLAFGRIKTESSTGIPEYDFSLNIGGLNAAIQYKTYVTEKYSEILVFETVQIETDTLYVGETLVECEGANGVAENVYEIAYADGVEVSRELISSTVISAAVDRVEYIGTKPYPSTLPTGTFEWPLYDSFVVYSEYGSNRPGLDPSGDFHRGVDLAGVTVGTPIYAADGGTVIFAGEQGTYGLIVKIRHEDGVETYYAHMDRLDVQTGDAVYKGQQIGTVGMTGRTTGPHLHFEVLINGSNVNPINYLPSTKPYQR